MKKLLLLLAFTTNTLFAQIQMINDSLDPHKHLLEKTYTSNGKTIDKSAIQLMNDFALYIKESDLEKEIYKDFCFSESDNQKVFETKTYLLAVEDFKIYANAELKKHGFKKTTADNINTQITEWDDLQSQYSKDIDILYGAYDGDVDWSGQTYNTKAREVLVRYGYNETIVLDKNKLYGVIKNIKAKQAAFEKTILPRLNILYEINRSNPNKELPKYSYNKKEYFKMFMNYYKYSDSKQKQNLHSAYINIDKIINSTEYKRRGYSLNSILVKHKLKWLLYFM